MLAVLTSADDDKLSGKRWAIKTPKRAVRLSTRYDRDHVEDRVIVHSGAEPWVGITRTFLQPARPRVRNVQVRPK